MQRLTLLGLAILLAGCLTGCEKPAEPAVPPRPALVMTVGNNASNESMVIVGEVRPRYESAQGFRIAGKIIERRVEIGSSVHKGQVIARLDAVDTSLNSQSAIADVRAAEAEHQLASAELERQRQLYAKKFISASALDAREAEFKTATARLQQAESKAAVSSNQSRYTSLLAERDGVITDIHAEPGQVVSAGEVIAKVADPKQLEVIVALAESAMQGVKVGDAAMIRLWADREKTYQAKVREIAPSADSTTRTFQAKVSILNVDDEIKLGMTAGVRFANANTSTLLVPTAAVTSRDGQPTVWIVNRKTQQVEPRLVKTGAFREDGVLIKEGLNAGEQVVVAGVHILVAGQKVRPVEAGVAK